MKELLETLKGMYEYIIIDTPPIVAVTDAVILATLVDAYIIVARAETTQLEIVSRSRETMNRVGGNLLGIVLNDFDISNNYGTYYKYYRYYKYDSYYGDDKTVTHSRKPRIVSRKNTNSST
jgi:tyrosine-protein kinase Etk/Wzc